MILRRARVPTVGHHDGLLGIVVVPSGVDFLDGPVADVALVPLGLPHESLAVSRHNEVSSLVAGQVRGSISYPIVPSLWPSRAYSSGTALAVEGTTQHFCFDPVLDVR